MARRTFTAGLLALLAACGGGGGGAAGDDGGGVAGGGSGGGTTVASGLAYGEITAFGSVWVNGVRYTTDDAVVRLNDEVVGQDDLKLGMVARVEAEGQRALAVSVDEVLKGPVEAVAADGTLTVMGQTVRVDAATRFDDGVRPVQGDTVEVYGLPLDGGVIAASFIERQAAPASPPFGVTGFVASQAGSALTIGGLTVDVSQAAAADMPAGSWVGLLVEVKGTACSGAPVCGRLTASRLEPVGHDGVHSADNAEIEGFVRAVRAGEFDLGGTVVRWSSGTVFVDGSVADIVPGAKLEAEGTLTDGTLTAAKIVWRDNVRLEADVAAVDGDRLTLAGLPGLSVQVPAGAERSGPMPGVGQHVELRGRLVPGPVVIAARVDVDRADPRVRLRAPVSAVAPPVITLLGMAVDTAGIDDSDFKDHDTVIGRSAFFAALTAGDAVQLHGDLAGTAVVWDEIELND